MPAAVDSVRVLEFSRDVRENLARLRGFVGLPVERFDRACDFETRTIAAAYLRQALEGLLAVGRHILARRFRLPAWLLRRASPVRAPWSASPACATARLPLGPPPPAVPGADC